MMPDPDRLIAGLRCRDLMTLVADYVDGELGADDVARVDAHLRECSHCLKFGAEYGTVAGNLEKCFAPQPITADARVRLAKRLDTLWADES